MSPQAHSSTPLDLVNLTPLMRLTSGSPEIKIGLIDGPVAVHHPELASQNIREIPGKPTGACARPASAACGHGTLVAGILSAKRGSSAPAISPGCVLLVRPIFSEACSEDVPTATPRELSEAIMDCAGAGVRVINLSMALRQPLSGEAELKNTLNYAASRGIILVAAAGNDGTVGGSAMSTHAWVIPVTGYTLGGRPLSLSNLGRSIGLRGLGAPGEGIVSTGATERSLVFGGASAAAAFVTGAIALLWSEFAASPASEIRLAITAAARSARSTVAPPLLDAWAAYRVMAAARRNRGFS